MHTGPDTRQYAATHRSLIRGRLVCRWILNDAGVPEMIWTCLAEQLDGFEFRPHGWESGRPDIRKTAETPNSRAAIPVMKAAA